MSGNFQFVTDFFGHFKEGFNKYKGLLNGENLKNVKDKAIKGVLLNWYVIIAGASIVVVSNVYTVLDEKGCVEVIEEFIDQHLTMIEDISQNCTGLLVQRGGPSAFYDCTGRYNPRSDRSCW